MPSSPLDRKQYVKQLLELYARTPGTPGRVSRTDRRLALSLYDRGVPLLILRKTLLLTCARRTLRAPEAIPLPSIRSLYYFLPVLEELQTDLPPDTYFDYLQHKLNRFYLARTGQPFPCPPWDFPPA